METQKDLIKEIKRQHKKHSGRFNFLGWVENKDLTPEVESYFSFINEVGITRGYDWVNGNQKLNQLIQEVTQ